MPIRFKPGKLLPEQKSRLEYLIRMDRLLQEYHQEKHKEYKEGKITLEDFRTWQNTYYEKRDELIQVTLTTTRDMIRIDSTILASLEDITG